MKKLMLAGLVAVLGFAPAFALAQAQAEEKMLVGQVQSVDETGTGGLVKKCVNEIRRRPSHRAGSLHVLR